MKHKITTLLVGLLAFCTSALADDLTDSYGVRFECRPEQLHKLSADVGNYIRTLGIGHEFIDEKLDAVHGTATYSLPRKYASSSTIYLAWNEALGIKDEILVMPADRSGKKHPISTVSKKEILFALLHPGRLTTFAGNACSAEALSDHVGLRQNVVAWSEDITWEWPDGTPAFWNKKYWIKGTPVEGVALHDALNDMFFQQAKYSIGCYTATKVVFAQAALDYYRRVKKDARTASLVEKRLLADGDPLVQIEPGAMWSFEDDFDKADMLRMGKIVHLQQDVQSGSFVPGDWLYFLNTDPKTKDKTGYEGSNSVYLGRNRFDDYYNDNFHHYNYREKIVEVYQWRNGVFSRWHDWSKITPVSAAQIDELSKSPEEGGLLMTYRAVPYLFGFESLPPLDAGNP